MYKRQGEDRAALRRMFLSEADFLLTGYPVRAGLVENNRPESNMWNGALLLRCALEYPDAPNAALYEEQMCIRDRGEGALSLRAAVPDVVGEGAEAEVVGAVLIGICLLYTSRCV